MARSKKKNKKVSPLETVGVSFVACLFGVVVGLIGSIGYSLSNVQNDEKEKNALKGKVYDDFQIHFLELGNIYAGDSIYVKAGDNDILIDAGSRPGSKDTIKEYVNEYCLDGKLEYVIATHAHQDHIAAFGCNEGIFYSYDIGTIIDFPITNSNTATFKKYKEGRDYAISNGATHYTALECYENKNGAKSTYTLGENMSFEILYNKYYEEETSNENEYSVCVLFKYGNTKYLLTGDLEEKGEKYLVEHNADLIKDCDLFKAGHHGSYTASTDELLDVVSPSISVCTCVCGSPEYTKNEANMFPSQKYIDRISKHTDKVYVTSLCEDYDEGKFTSMNGNVIVSSDGVNVDVACSNNNTVLKDTEWFKNNRTCPEAWM